MTASAARRGGAIRIDRLIVTRPAQDAVVWTDALRSEGWPAHALPLIEIGEPDDASTMSALRHWRAHWLQVDAIMFVSAAAVGHFFATGVSAAPPGQDVRTRFWAPGPGTAQALVKALAVRGVGAHQVDAPPADSAQFDSEALWPVVAAQIGPGCRVLIVRGQSEVLEPGGSGGAAQVAGSGREWLIRQIMAEGAQVDGCVAYVRRAPAFSEADRMLAMSATTSGSVWLFSSSEALDHLRSITPAAGWASARALVTHPRIAAAAREAGFDQVMECRPSMADVLRALESHWSRI